MFIFTLTLYDSCRNEDGGVRAARAEEEKKAETLLAEITAGSREALSGLYELMGGQVYGYALSIVKNHHEAQDIQQDVFVKIWSCAGQYRPGTKARAWIYTITKNLSLTSLRKAAGFRGKCRRSRRALRSRRGVGRLKCCWRSCQKRSGR